MDFEIIGRHVNITPEIKEYAESRLDKAPKFFDRIHGLKAIFAVEGDGFEVEFIAYLIKCDSVIAKAADKDIFVALDAASDKLESQLRRYNDKLKQHRVRPAAPEAEGEVEDEEIEFEEDLA